MSEHNDKPHIVPYKTFLLVLFALFVLTAVSIAVTNYNLGPVTVLTALFLATAKTILVLTFFMHLKWDVRMFAILIASI